MSLLEGHGNFVMDELAKDSVDAGRADAPDPQGAPGVGAGGIEKTFQRAIGFEAKVRQYDQGERFVAEVVESVGMEGFNRVWQERTNLPTMEEVARPERWVRRVGTRVSGASWSARPSPGRRSRPASASPAHDPPPRPDRPEGSKVARRPSPAAPTPCACSTRCTASGGCSAPPVGGPRGPRPVARRAPPTPATSSGPPTGWAWSATYRGRGPPPPRGLARGVAARRSGTGCSSTRCTTPTPTWWPPPTRPTTGRDRPDRRWCAAAASTRWPASRRRGTRSCRPLIGRARGPRPRPSAGPCACGPARTP